MDFFKNALCWVGLSAPRRRPNALEFSPLCSLPAEIIIQIPQFLPPESAASFLLCCRPVYSALGHRYLEDLRSKHGLTVLYRERFLITWERDLPDHIVCYYCIKFHAIKKGHRHLPSNSNYFTHFKCWKKDYDSLASLYIHEMTMKQYRQGLEYSDLLALISLKPATNFRLGYVAQETAVAKIVNGNLLVREQKRFMIPATQPIPSPWDASFAICPHIAF